MEWKSGRRNRNVEDRRNETEAQRRAREFWDDPQREADVDYTQQRPQMSGEEALRRRNIQKKKVNNQ